MIFISWSRGHGKLILRKYFPLTIFTKCFIIDVWYSRCLNKHWILNMPEFWIYWGPGWIYQGSEYVSDFECVRVLNIPCLWICQVIQGFEYTWIIPGYAWLCLNVPKSVWMAFDLHLPIIIPYLQKPYTISLESENFFCLY